MHHKQRTSVKVDFAGTKDELRAYVVEHGKEFPKGLSLGRGGKGEFTCNGDYILYARIANGNDLCAVQKAFDKLGWDIASQY